MKRRYRGNRWVEFSEITETYCDGDPCYMVRGRGDSSLYLGEGDARATVLALEEKDDGWVAYYQPDGDFEEVIRLRELAGMRGWGG